MDKKIVKARVVGRSWGGDIYETMDGKRYWLGDRNGKFLKKYNPLGDGAPEPSQTSSATSPVQEYPDHYIDFQPSGISFLEGVLGLAVGSALISILLCVFAVAMFFYALVAAWPRLITQIVGDFAKGAINIPLILLSAAVIFLIVYFVLSVCKVIKTGAIMSKKYAVLCILATSIPYILFDLFCGIFSISAILLRLVDGAIYALLPVVILSCIEYKSTGGEHLIRSIAQMICRGNVIKRLIFAGAGVFSLIASVIFILFLLPTIGILTGLGLVIAFLFTGVFALLVSIFGNA